MVHQDTQPRTNLAMCCHLAGDTHPAPPFLLAQSLSPKVSAGREDNLT